jgi:hypothetical protein
MEQAPMAPPAPQSLLEKQEPIGSRWSFDVTVGLPLAIRGQRRLSGDNLEGLQAEALVGLYTIAPMIGGGLRWRHTLWEDGCNAWQLNPGLDGFFLLNPFYKSSGLLSSDIPGAALLALDVDILWRHDYGSCGEGMFGLKLGIGVGHAVGNGSRDTEWIGLPIGSLLFGWRF